MKREQGLARDQSLNKSQDGRTSERGFGVKKINFVDLRLNCCIATWSSKTYFTEANHPPHWKHWIV